MKLIRTFIAINIPRETKEEIGRTIENLGSKFKKYSQDLKWVDPFNLHVTLSFQGSITLEDIATLEETVEKVAQSFPPCEIKLGDISYYYTDKKGSDSVIYIGIVDPEKNISALYKTLAKQLRLSGFSPTNRIDPHITIGRLAKRKDRQLQTEILDTISTSGTTYVSSPETGIVKVEKLYIYESISMPTQTKYRIIRSFNLSG